MSAIAEKKNILMWPMSAIAEKKCKKSAAYVCHRPGRIAMPMQT